MNFRYLILLICILIIGCTNQIVVSINEQPIYDPSGRLRQGEVLDADLQGCINLALQQQDMDFPSELSALSCADARITDLEKISQLAKLRFLDLGGNNISNITPLEELSILSGLNLKDNQIRDITPLLNMPNLTSVNLQGNDGISCSELNRLENRSGLSVAAPDTCTR